MKFLKKSISASLVLFVLVFSFTVPVSADWTYPKNQPPQCNDNDPGCSPPINVSGADQLKSGGLGLYGNLALITGKFISFISDQTLALGAPVMGKIFYSQDAKFKTSKDNKDALNIFGVNIGYTTGKIYNRVVQIWDNLYVRSTTTTTNLVVTNRTELSPDTYICKDQNSCTQITNVESGSPWTKAGASIYQKILTDKVGIGNNNPQTLLDVGNNTDLFNGPSYLKINAPANRVAGIQWATSGTTNWYLYRPANSTDLRLNNNSTNILTIKNDGKMTSVGDICTTVAGSEKCLSTSGSGSGNLPAGTSGQTLYHNGSTWVAANNLKNTGQKVTIESIATQGPIFEVGGGKLAVIDNLSSTQIETKNLKSTDSFAANNIVANGSVGIGVDNPQAKLHVNGVGLFTDGVLLNGNSFISNSNVLKFGQGVLNENKIGFKAESSSAKSLDIIGSRPSDTDSGARQVTIFDNLTVPGKITTPSICSGVGSCVDVTKIINGDNWVKTSTGNGIYYSKGLVGIGTNNPQGAFHVGYGDSIFGGSVKIDQNLTVGSVKIDQNLTVGSVTGTGAVYAEGDVCIKGGSKCLSKLSTVEVNSSSSAAGNLTSIKIDGTNWSIPSGASGATYTAGVGLKLEGTTFSARNIEALWNAGSLLGKPLSFLSSDPPLNYILKYDGFSWKPMPDENSFPLFITCSYTPANGDNDIYPSPSITVGPDSLHGKCTIRDGSYSTTGTKYDIDLQCPVGFLAIAGGANCVDSLRKSYRATSPSGYSQNWWTIGCNGLIKGASLTCAQVDYQLK